ncbi:hypothetical protein BX600DRAFT_503209 [Xylariales sp. PMI_506]|nr:hypothetical protein BX600DRAFT_503209 [Xylariales sp. PMI_506]
MQTTPQSNSNIDLEKGGAGVLQTPKPEHTVSVFNVTQNPAQRDGAHLASGEIYRKKIARLQKRNPNLRHKDWKIPESREDFVVPSRAKLIKIRGDGFPEVQDQWLEPHGLQESIQRRLAVSDSDGCLKNVGYLYLLEGVNPDYTEAIGSQLVNIDPAFFLRHQRTPLWEGRNEGGLSPCLASQETPEKTWLMEYCELLYFTENPGSFSLRNPLDNRHINVSMKPDISKDIDQVGIMHRKASFWSQTHENGNWEALIVLDPPLPESQERGQRVILKGPRDGAQLKDFSVKLYQGGYLDFLDCSIIEDDQIDSGPPRTSIMDDLCFYFKAHGHLINSSDPIVATTFLQKIVASNYIVLCGYLEACLSELETDIARTRITKRRRDQALEITNQMAILLSWDHRLPEYCGMIDNILARRHFSDGSMTPMEWHDCTVDFQGIKQKLAKLHRRAETLKSLFVGLASMAGAREALDEANNVQFLTILGTFFLLLSFISSLFAMPNPYGPENGKFWLYSTTAFPVAGVVTLGAGAFICWRRR